MQVVEIYERSFTQVIIGELELAHLGSQDSLCGSRQRGVAHGQRLIVREVARLLLWRERVAAQVHGEDEVGLFDDLLAIEVKVREMQEQRVLVRRGVGEVPYLVFGKGLGLRGHSEALVIRDEHLLSRLAPPRSLVPAPLAPDPSKNVHPPSPP